MSEVREGYKMTELGEIPIEWEVTVLENTVEVLDGLRKPIKKNDRAIGDIPYYGATGIIDWVNDFIFDEPLVLVGEDGENLRSRVLPMAFKIDGKAWVNNHAHVLKPNPNIDIDFLTAYLESVKYDDYITGSAQPKLNQAQLKKVKVVLPSFNEQHKIASILSTVDEQIDKTEQLIVKTKKLKKGLMQKLLTKGIGHTEFKQTELGEIPVEWEVTSLNDLMELLTDYEANGSFKSVKDNVNISESENFAVFVRATDLEKGTYSRFVDSKSYEFLTKTTLYGGELLISKRGQIGKVYLMPQLNRKATLAPNLYLLKLNSSKTMPKFLYYYMISEFGQKLLLKNSATTTLGALYKDDVKKMKVLYPPLKEQEDIVSILSTVDEQIKVYEQEKVKYEELKKGLMQQLLTGHIRVKI